MKKKVLIPVLIAVALFLLVSGVVLVGIKGITKIDTTKEEKETIDEELLASLKKRLVMEEYTLEYVKYEKNIYYFNQVDKDGKVVLEVQYDAEKDSIATLYKNTISEEQIEEDS